jgi:VanZ family protein
MRILGELKDRFGTRVVAVNALVLLIASWTPRSYMLRSGIASGQAEHFLAYSLSSALMFAMLAERHAAWRVAVVVVAYAGFLELCQTFVPGRHAALEHFYCSAAGAIIGVLACAALRHRLRPNRKTVPPGASKRSLSARRSAALKGFA